MIEFKKIIIEGFCSIGTLELPLNNNGITIIKGANGLGKTTIFSALAHGSAQALDHTGEHILEVVTAEVTDDARDDDGHDQGQVSVMVTGFGMTEEAVKHEPDHRNDGN